MLVIHLHFPQRWEEPGDVETLARVAETVVIISVSDKRLSSSDPCSVGPHGVHCTVELPRVHRGGLLTRGPLEEEERLHVLRKH